MLRGVKSEQQGVSVPQGSAAGRQAQVRQAKASAVFGIASKATWKPVGKAAAPLRPALVRRSRTRASSHSNRTYCTCRIS